MKSNLPKLYKRQDSPYYYFSVYIGNKRVQKPTNIPKTIQEEKALTLLMDALKINPAPVEYNLLWMRDFVLRRLELRNLAPKSYYIYRITLDKFLDCLGSEAPINSVNKEKVFRFQNYLVNMGLKPGTVNMYSDVIKTAFNALVYEEITDKNPFKGMKKINRPENKDVPLSLSPDQIALLLKTAEQDNPEHYRLLLLSIYIGYRRKDILNIPRSGIDFDNRTFIINVSKKKNSELVTLSMPNQIVFESLKYFCDKYPTAEYPCKIMYIDSYSRWFKRMVKLSNLPDNIHLHTLRHSFVTNALNQGYPIYDIKAYLRHSSLSVTEIYTHRRIQKIELDLSVTKTVTGKG